MARIKKVDAGNNTPSSGCSRWDYRATIKREAKRARRKQNREHIKEQTEG